MVEEKWAGISPYSLKLNRGREWNGWERGGVETHRFRHRTMEGTSEEARTPKRLGYVPESTQIRKGSILSIDRVRKTRFYAF